MTIEVEITNKDTVRSLVVKVFDFKRGEYGPPRPTVTETILPTFTSVFHVHLLRQIELSEYTPDER